MIGIVAGIFFGTADYRQQLKYFLIVKINECIHGTLFLSFIYFAEVAKK